MSSTPNSVRHRILVLIKGLGIGGAEKLVSEGARWWDRDRFDYSVAYVLPWKDQLVGELVDLGVDVTCIGGRRGLGAGVPLAFRRLVRETRPALIHAHLPTAGILSRVSTRVPTVYTEHNTVDSYRWQTRLLNRWTYGLNSAVIAVSTSVAESLRGYPGPGPRVIPNGVAANAGGDTMASREEFGVDSNTPIIVHVGNIRPHKGHKNLIEATRLLIEDIPAVQVISIGGEKHPGDLDRIREEAVDAGVSANIRFLGRREDARRLIALADVVVNPSDFEGLPVSLLEALALARPVVATDVGGVASIIHDEETGLLVPPSDPKALARGIHRALSDPRASTWGEAGARLVKEDFSIESMIRSYEAIYLELLDE